MSLKYRSWLRWPENRSGFLALWKKFERYQDWFNLEEEKSFNNKTQSSCSPSFAFSEDKTMANFFESNLQLIFLQPLVVGEDLVGQELVIWGPEDIATISFKKNRKKIWTADVRKKRNFLDKTLTWLKALAVCDWFPGRPLGVRLC